MSPWLSLLFIALVPMVIPVAILLGFRSPNGSLVITSVATIAAFAAFWVPLGGISGVKSGFSAYYPLNFFFIGAALMLFVASWALGLTAAVRSRRWLWVALLLVAGYISAVAVIVSISAPDPCLFPPSYPLYYTYCQTSNPLAEALIMAGYFLAPAAVLASTLQDFPRRILLPRRLGPPDGLQVAPLSASSASDTDPEMRVERL